MENNLDKKRTIEEINEEINFEESFIKRLKEMNEKDTNPESQLRRLNDIKQVEKNIATLLEEKNRLLIVRYGTTDGKNNNVNVENGNVESVVSVKSGGVLNPEDGLLGFDNLNRRGNK